MSSLWAALTKGVVGDLDVEGSVADLRVEREGGGGYDKAVAEDYSALINRILDRTVTNWRVELNTLNAKHRMTKFDVDPEPPVVKRSAYTGGHHKTAAQMEAEAREAGILG